MVPSVLVCVWGMPRTTRAFARIVVTVVLFKTDSVRGKAQVKQVKKGGFFGNITRDHNRSNFVPTNSLLLLRQWRLLTASLYNRRTCCGVCLSATLTISTQSMRIQWYW